MNFKLHARINRSDARTIRQALDRLSAKGSVRKEGDEFVVEAEMDGASAKELNRTLLPALRKVEKRTTLRAEWISDDGTSERFFRLRPELLLSSGNTGGMTILDFCFTVGEATEVKMQAPRPVIARFLENPRGNCCTQL